MKITNISEDTYTTLTNNNIPITYAPANGTLYDDFIGSLSYDKTRAIEAVYHNGYITEDEAKHLKEDGYAKRNAFTNIYISESFDKITIYCLEHDDVDSLSNINTIFKLSYDKMTGFVVDEMNIDIAN